MDNYRKKQPEIISARKITENDFSGKVKVCAYELKHLLFIDERRREPKYENENICCEWEDDGHCLKKTGSLCKHCREIGYIKVNDSFNGICYPMIGDYIIVKDNTISIMKKEIFEENYELIKEEKI